MSTTYTPFGIPSNTGSTTAGGHLVNWWKCDEGTGTTLHDSGSSGDDATLNGAISWASDCPCP